MIESVLKEIKDVLDYPSVTILLKTHRSHPENKKDSTKLRNLLKEAENRLLEEFNKREVGAVLENLKKYEDGFDHNLNLDSLVIFVNKDIANHVRLPIEVESRVIIDQNFATRDLVRALHKSEHYYILRLNLNNVQLFEAFADRPVKEVVGNGFPIENNLYNTDTLKRSMGEKQDNMSREFFNRVDKTFQDFYKSHPAGLVITGADRNIAFYKEICDNDRMIMGEIKKNLDNLSTYEMVKEAWPVALDYIKQSKSEALDLLGSAVGQNKFASDLTDIWKMVNQGRGDVLLVENDFFQPAIIQQDGSLKLAEDQNEPGVIDDIIDELMEVHLSMGGRVVFMDPGQLDNHQKIALILRY
jgi:hypothetical protein